MDEIWSDGQHLLKGTGLGGEQHAVSIDTRDQLSMSRLLALLMPPRVTKLRK